MGAPQLIWISLAVLGAAFAMAKPKPIDRGISVVAISLNAGLLYWGGFFG